MVKSLLLLPPRYTEDSILLWQCAASLGWETQRVYSWRVEEAWRSEFARIVVYGEPVFADVVAGQLGLVLVEPPFDWLVSLAPVWLQRQIIFTTYAEARRLVEPHFIKPADGKTFEARVYESGSMLPLQQEWERLPVLAAEPVTWRAEFRCFILEGRMITCSPYWRDNHLAQDDTGGWPFASNEEVELTDFITRLLADPTVQLPPSVVIDVGIIEGRGWAVIEANPAWGSGVYGCDPKGVLEVIARGCVRREDLRTEEARWVPVRAD